MITLMVFSSKIISLGPSSKREGQLQKKKLKQRQHFIHYWLSSFEGGLRRMITLMVFSSKIISLGPSSKREGRLQKKNLNKGNILFTNGFPPLKED
jgi:hypothetical protein